METRNGLIGGNNRSLETKLIRGSHLLHHRFHAAPNQLKMNAETLIEDSMKAGIASLLIYLNIRVMPQ